MSRVLAFLAAAALSGVAPAALAQAPAAPPAEAIPTAPAPPAPAPPPLPPTPAAVQVAPLAAPDAFSTPGRDTGLPPTLWRGTSLAIARSVLPVLAERPLTPAGAALARRVLATGAQGPEGAGSDPALTAARAQALMTQGDPKAAAAILARAPGLDRDAGLARAAAETALLAGQDARACAIGDALTADRDDIYWLRLRTYCQAIAGKTGEAQLTFDLAQAQAKDPVFVRLMAAKLGAGDPGPASARNGLDLALSRSLGLDLGQAKPAPEVAAALSPAGPPEPAFDVASAPPDLAATETALVGAGPLPPAELERLMDAADTRDPRLHARGQAAALLAAPFAEPLGPTLRARVAALSVPVGRASAARLMVMSDAAAGKRLGETALMALWIAADAGPSGLAPGERAEIVRALHIAGFERDARAFALEGLLGLK